MDAYALNPKLCALRPDYIIPSNNEEVMEEFMKAICKMYSVEEATIL